MAKKYTDKSLAGAGAVAGVPCQIQSITPITGGNRVTFLWVDNNNVSHTSTLDVMDGAGGEENKIDSISVNGYPISIDENKNVDITVPSIEGLTKDTDLATVAKSGSYEDLSNKPEIPSVEGFAKTTDIRTKVSELENDSNYVSSIPEEYVTETELDAKGYLTEHQDISGKVDKVEGKSLISDTEIARLASVNNYDDTDIRTELANKADTTAIPNKVSELTNDRDYQTAEQVNSAVTTEIAKVVADAPESLNTLKEMSDWIAGHENDASAMNSAITDNKNAITALQTGKADKNDLVDKADKSYVDNNLGELSTKTTSTIVKTNANLLYLGAKQLGIEPTDNFYIFKITAFCEDGYNISLAKYKHGVTLLVKTISNSKTTITATNQVGTITYSGTLKCAYVEYIGVADESVDFGSGRDVTELATMDDTTSSTTSTYSSSKIDKLLEKREYRLLAEVSKEKSGTFTNIDFSGYSQIVITLFNSEIEPVLLKFEAIPGLPFSFKVFDANTIKYDYSLALEGFATYTTNVTFTRNETTKKFDGCEIVQSELGYNNCVTRIYGIS